MFKKPYDKCTDEEKKQVDRMLADAYRDWGKSMTWRLVSKSPETWQKRDTDFTRDPLFQKLRDIYANANEESGNISSADWVKAKPILQQLMAKYGLEQGIILAEM